LLDRAQLRVLERMATGADLGEILDAIVRLVEEQGSGALCSILVLDEGRLRHGAAPSLPEEYVRAVDDREIGPDEGSCGAAAFHRTRVIVEDIDTHPSWTRYRAIALAHGLRACWSTPIFSPQREVLGTFAIYHRAPRAPTPGELAWVDVATHVAAIAIARDRATAAQRKTANELHEREDRLRFIDSINETIRTATDSRALLREVLALLGARLHASRVGYAEIDDDGDRCFISDDWSNGCASIVGEHRLSSFGPKVIAALRGGGKAAVVRDVVGECGPEEQGAFAALQIGAFFCCALIREGVPRAMMYVHDRAARDWQPGDVAVAQEVVERLWTAIEQRSAEAKLRHNEAQLRLAGQAAKVGGWSLELPDRKVSWSEQLYAMHELPRGTPPTVAHALESCAPEYLDAATRAIAACIRDGTPFDTELQIVTATGKRLWVRAIGSPERDASGKIVRIRGALQDVDDRHRLAEQLRQSQKMDAIGQLAGGVAHDFNNLLSVILSYAAFIMDGLPPGDAVRSDVEEIQRAGLRATELTRQLTTFSRQQPLAPRLLDLNEVLAGFTSILRRLVGEHVSLSVVPGDGLGRVLLDPGQVEQVIMNLVVNARDAMPGGGTLTIETSRAPLDAAYAADRGVAPGDYGVIAVTDTGHGMDAATRERIFEPFFTTKPRGKGTGIGLATVYGIVTQSGGHIRVDSQPGVGTTFRVYFPCRSAEPVAAASVAPPPPVARRGSETVLLVEDDEQVRAAVRSVIRRAGYKVLDAANGADALIVSEQHGGRVHLLLTDVVMPRISGPELARRLGGTRPDMRVLYMSGYSREDLAQHGVREDEAQVLSKPIAPDVLLSAIGDRLDASPASRRPPDLDTRPPRPAANRGERILHVDDEEALVLLTGRFLRKLGYRVTGFTDPHEALRAFAAQPNDFDAVITDIMMPSMSGFDLVREVRQRRPDVPIVVTSGYFRAEDLREAQELELRGLLVKPDTVDELGQVLHAELQRRA
jgi:signal transduction histidine kinase/CheY-like chemotaxis protein